MRVLLFLNELSCEHGADERTVDDGMRDLVETVRQIRSRRKDAALVSTVPLKDVELSENYRVSQWINKRGNRDRWRLLQSARNMAPIGAALTQDTDEVEYTHRNRRAEGLAGAHLADGLAVSLPVHPDWLSSWIDVDRCRVVEDDGVQLVHDTVQVRHAGRPVDGSKHEDWIDSSGLAGIVSGAELWAGVGDFFTHIRFLDRVEQDLRGLDRVWLRSVRERLVELDRTVAQWEPSRSRHPAWRSYVTPESESRMRLCEFADLDGVVRPFSLHARFTPGAGRIHFRLDPEQRMMTVGYIGRKLGA
ncbi:hypothetical protein [Saccharomonospora iraqiensis]|uniref:hypothetical protein n=1 Tax=Saccharomonospora iraqiensis TaxID=52698 RepID=UPI00022E7BF3|nr:hypothetical protein [Saccharomonospora iraqiensis]